MKKNYLMIMLVAVQMILLSCGEEPDYRAPVETGSAIPTQVREIGFKSLSGAVRLFYELPNDPNVAQVRARYVLSTGQVRTVSASIYTDFMILDGFSDTEEHDVEVFTVSKSGKESEPVIATVKANEAAIWKVKRSLEFTDQFGGFNIEGSNPDTAAVYVFIMDKNEFDEYEVNNFTSFASTFSQIDRPIRGLDTLTYTYRYFVMDKWNNSTDTTTVSVNPLYETLIPKTGYASYRLPGDAPLVTNGSEIEFAWDGRVDTWPSALFTSQNDGPNGPHMVTFDIGVETKLSRFWYRPYPEFWDDPSTIQYFFLTTMRYFEVYGSLNPNTNGQLDSTWIQMGQFEVVKPSGSPYGADTPEDVAAAKEGFNYNFPPTLPKVRYIRIRCLQNWADGTAMSIGECEFYGDPR